MSKTNVYSMKGKALKFDKYKQEILSIKREICPKCGDLLIKSQIYDSINDYYNDGPFKFELICNKCKYRRNSK